MAKTKPPMFVPNVEPTSPAGKASAASARSGTPSPRCDWGDDTRQERSLYRLCGRRPAARCRPWRRSPPPRSPFQLGLQRAGPRTRWRRGPRFGHSHRRQPGAGKSTLLLQTMCGLAQRMKTLYVTGEESLQQVAMRANRRLVCPRTSCACCPRPVSSRSASSPSRSSPRSWSSTPSR